MTAYQTGRGINIKTNTVLGKGGEATVFHVDGDRQIAAKIYTDGKSLQRRDKVSSMVAADLHKRSDLVAFPVDTLFDTLGNFAGFTMRKVEGFKPVHELYSPGSRKLYFPGTDFRFLARTATNVARAIANVHQTGCVIGDINHSGVLVSPKATVTLIDADSFQMRLGSLVYRCLVGVGEYTPPELQGLQLSQVDRDPSHDGFGLAVLVFQLLFMGRHPYAGRFAGPGDMPIEKAITEGRFAYTIARKSEARMDPPPFVPTLIDVTEDVRRAFEAAFTSKPALYRSRPSASDWVEILNRFEAELIPCQANPSHHHLRNSPGCPWCRLESGMGVALFPSAATTTAPPRPSNFDLEKAMAAIAAVVSPGQSPDPTVLTAFQMTVIKSGEAHKAHERRNFRLGGAAVVAIIALIALAAGVAIAFLGLPLAAYMAFTQEKGVGLLRDNKVRAQRDWQSALMEWETEAGPSRFDGKKSVLTNLASEYRGLPGLEKNRLDDLDRRRRDIQLQRFLEGISSTVPKSQVLEKVVSPH